MTVMVLPSISQRMSTWREMRLRIWRSVWSIALRLMVPSMPGWMSKLTFVSRAIASSTSRTGWLVTTTEYLISGSRASGGGGSGAARTGWGIDDDGGGGRGASAVIWPSDFITGRVPQPAATATTPSTAATPLIESKNITK